MADVLIKPSLSTPSQRAVPRTTSTGNWRTFPLEFMLLVVSGTGAFLFADTDAKRSVPLMAGVLLCFSYRFVVFASQVGRVRLQWGYGSVLTVIATAIGLWGVLLGWFRGNDLYYVAADVFHWYIEGIAVAVLCAWAISRSTPATVARGLTAAAAAIAAVTFAGAVAGHRGLLETGGQQVLNGLLWQIKMGVNYPQTLLIFVAAACLIRRTGQRRSLFAWFVLGALGVILILTFKRTMWLSTAFVMCFLFVPRGKALRSLVVSAVVFIIAANFYLVSWGTPLDILDALSYNPDYTVEDTLTDRRRQLNDALDEWRTQGGGQGFGAELYVFMPDTRKVDVTHYIHSNYVYWLVQLGLPGLVLILGLWVSMARRLCNQIDMGGDWEWLLRASLAGLVTLALNSLTLNATHSLYAGLTYGIAAMALARARQDA